VKPSANSVIQRAALIVAVCLLSSTLQAQGTQTEPSKKYCWRGQPIPACDRFLLTEFGFYRSIVQPAATVTYSWYPDSTQQSSYQIRDTPWNFTWEVGGMVNANARTAVGATILLGANDDGGTVGIKARYRRWLNSDGIALDVGAGVRTSQSDRGTNATYLGPSSSTFTDQAPPPAFTGDVAINARDYVSLVARVDIARFDNRYQPNISLGVRAGSIPAVIGTGALATTYAALITLFLIAWND